jgi:hypothetical protein
MSYRPCLREKTHTQACSTTAQRSGYCGLLFFATFRASQDFVPLYMGKRKLAVGESTVRDRLLKAGFTEEFVGEDRPPATHYHYGQAGGFYLEFLTSLVGSEYDRKGKRKVTQEGVSSRN